MSDKIENYIKKVLRIPWYRLEVDYDYDKRYFGMTIRYFKDMNTMVVEHGVVRS